MQVYLVGGAVRDELLGLPVRERDWVVVGATPDELTTAGYVAVGRDFPVFLHPDTKEEYALARQERKTGPGYRGFVTEFSPAVTLAEDLRRRDLTINAMARDEQGRITDPYGGQQDLAARVLRHVSPAFVEDPVRILRVARFAARFAPLGFRVAPETLTLMQRMVADGEAAALVPERVWQELVRALGEAQPARFFGVLRDCGALAVILPEIDELLEEDAARVGGGTQTMDSPLAGEARAHAASSAAPGPGAPAGSPPPATALDALRMAVKLQASPPLRFACMLCGMEEASAEQLCTRLRVPSEYRELLLLSIRLGAVLHATPAPPPVAARDPAWRLRLFELGDAFRRAGRFREWLEALGIRAAAGGVPASAAREFSVWLGQQLAVASAVQLPAGSVAPGPDYGAKLHAARLAALAATAPLPLPPPAPSDR